jgi:hypothetical protein
MDKKNFYILKTGEVIYAKKRGFKTPEIQSQLESIIKEYNDRLNKNETLGQLGKGYERKSTIPNGKQKKINTQIDNKITIDTFKFGNEINPESIDATKTYKERTGIEPSIELEDFIIQQFKSDKATKSEKVRNPLLTDVYDDKITWWVFDGEGRFLNLIANMKKQVEVIKNEIQDDITSSLSELLQQQQTLGFVPNIRNVLAVFFANAEAFLRLMEEVHEKAWAKNKDKCRIDAIFNESSVSADILTNNEKIVYPWPQLVVKNEQKDTTYELKYPGDDTIKNFVQADNYDVWPEVEFVEEYIRALVERVSRDTKQNTIANEISDVKRLSVNAIEFPITNEVFFKLETVKFFYEIFERINYTIYYSKINKGNPSILPNLISEIESKNIEESLKAGAPDLILRLKETSLNGSNYQELLKQYSNNGIGVFWGRWERGIYNTDYINNQVSSPFGIKPSNFLNSLKTTPLFGLKPETTNDLKNWLTGLTKSNTIDFTDTYPFTNNQWIKNNLAEGNSTDYLKAYNTTKTISYQDGYKTLTNFENKDITYKNRPITNFLYENTSFGTIPSYPNLKTYYDNRVSDYKKQLVTEGNLFYSENYDGKLAFSQTTSMLNTPYFVNGIQKGVELAKQKSVYPYVGAAYLFLNSLPLITGKEKLKTFENQSTTETDYIFATLKKYGAVHKLPYAWILKIGSIYHRYKKYTNENIDILNDIWTEFDYLNNYDPISGLTTTKYTFTSDTITYNVVLQQDVVNGTNTTTQINLGFYPKVINDFAYFYTGVQPIKDTYTSTDIQNALSGKTLYLINSDSAGFNFPKGVDPSQPNRNISVQGWSSYLSGSSLGLYLLPSVGGINQTKVECFENSESTTSARLKVEVNDNTSMYNGSVRNFWLAPNFGYFDNGKVVKPRADRYIKQVFSGKAEQENYSINNNLLKYSYIDELFSLFDTQILDYFENEFLNFSKSDTNFTTTLVSNGDSYKLKFYNFQLLMKGMMRINLFTNQGQSGLSQGQSGLSQGQSGLSQGQSGLSNVSPQKITDYSDLQVNQINSFLKGFLEEDIYFVYGNPSNYNKRLFYSFSDLPLKDKFEWVKYTESTPNVLPNSSGTPNLATSQILKPNEWKTLKTYVGFSNIPELTYKDTGSYITDFFIDFNVAFTEPNIKTFAPIIKLYATQKLNQNQSNQVNTNQPANANILIYQANLSNGNVFEINETTSNRIAIVRNLGVQIFTKNYPTNTSINVITDNILLETPFNGVTISEVIYDQPSNQFPTNPSSLTNSDGASAFRNSITSYLNGNEDIINQVINTFWPKLQSGLANSSITPKKVNISQLQGDPQTKLELWEIFKSLNDKWISGNDYKIKTLFEDVMLLDRASRNIGEKVLVDIFKLKELINPSTINLKTDVITFVESILVENNFLVMTLPSYVNFYGIQNVSGNAQPRPEGTLEFANTLFGTFTNVDYRDSSTKLVCQFIDRPSEYVDMSDNPDFRFRDDAFDILKESDNPISENLEGKTDYDKSNRVVGFNVDIGVQNQQIFKNFSIGQNAGLATSEALEVLNQMANQGGGRNVATQNMSLFNLYKNRSYTCNLSMMGNALIQPTMYFNLRYVPMFSGPYMITEVNHSISPGDFSTDIVGIRQPVASLPILDKFLQGLRTNLVKQIDEKVELFAKNSPNAAPSNIITQQNIVSGKDETVVPPSSDCKTDLSEYNKFTAISTPQTEKETFVSMKVIIKESVVNANLVDNDKLAKTIFSYFYTQSGVQNGFEAPAFNFGNINLLQSWGPKSQYFSVTAEFFCKSQSPPTTLQNQGQSGLSQGQSGLSQGQSGLSQGQPAQTNKVTPYAKFGNTNLSARFFVEFWKGRGINNVDVTNTDTNVVIESITKFIILNADANIKSESFYTTFITNNKDQYAKIKNQVGEAIKKYDIS